MDVLEAIFTRRSIRKYTGEPVSEEDLQTILRAGAYAPSAHNGQPWHFIIVRDSQQLKAIAEEHPYAKMMPQAGCCIIVCGDKEKQALTGFLVEDCAAAIQNMLLAARGLGLGTVWCGLYPVTNLTHMICERFKLPENIIPVGMVALGHAGETRQVKERFDPQRLHYETW